jgi:hypothetical protein
VRRELANISRECCRSVRSTSIVKDLDTDVDHEVDDLRFSFMMMPDREDLMNEDAVGA